MLPLIVSIAGSTLVGYIIYLSPLDGSYYGGFIVGAVSQLGFWAVAYWRKVNER